MLVVKIEKRRAQKVFHKKRNFTDNKMFLEADQLEDKKNLSRKKKKIM